MIASLSSDKVDTVSEVQAIVDAIDAVFANAARLGDDDTTNTVTVTKEQLLTLGFDGSGDALEVTDYNLDAIQRVLTDQAGESAVTLYSDLRDLINTAITAHADILNAATRDTAADIDEADYAAMGIDGVDTGNISSINDALVNTTNSLTTAASVQEMVDSYNHILDLRAGDANGGDSNIALDADDFTDLGVTLKGAGAEQDQQLAYLQEIVKDRVGNGSIATVADLQKIADATSDLIDMIQEASPDSDGVTGLTPEQFALLGIDDGNDPAGAITAAQADMLSKRLALTADDLSDVANLATHLKGLWDAATASLAKIKTYAESDATADYDASGSFDSGDVPTVDDFKNIGVVEYDNGTDRTAIDATNISAINELFAAVSVGADTGDGDLPATTAAEDQYVIDQGATRLQAIAKIVAYAEANVRTPADATLIPDAADFIAAGVTGVDDANNVPALLTKLAALGSSSNGLASDTALELQAFVKQVAIDKIKAWTDTDGGNSAAPILQDYLNANLVSFDGNAITEAMVPVLNELFAGTMTSAGDADNQTEQQAVIDGAGTMLAAMAKIASYAQADGSIDFYPEDGVNDHLTVADFEKAGVSGVGDGTNLSVGSGTSTSANGYNNLEAVLDKLAENGVKYINADTLEEVQALVAEVAAEKIAYYADVDGQWPAVSESYTLYSDTRAAGGGNAFFIGGAEAPDLDLQPGTYTFDVSDASLAGTVLTFARNSDGSGGLPAGVSITSTGTAGQAGATVALTVEQGFEGSLYYTDANALLSGGTATADPLYFEPAVQDYTNAGLQDPNDAAISENQLPFVNAIFAQTNIGNVTEDAGNGVFNADDFSSQQAAIDYYGAQLLSLEKFVDYMIPGTGNTVLKSDFTLADFSNAGLVRITDADTMRDILDLLPSYETKDTLTRTDLGSVDAIQAFVSRAIIANYEADPANHQVPVGADYVAAGITGADDDNAAAMNYQVANNAGYADSITALEALVTPANAAIGRLTNFELDHIAPISNDSQITVAGLKAYTLGVSDFGDYLDPSSDALTSIKVSTVPTSGRLLLEDETPLTVTKTTTGADAVAGGAAAVAEVHSIDASSLTANAVYALDIGADRVKVTVDADPTAAELAVLLEGALGKAGIPVTAANPSSTNDVTLTWDVAGAVSEAVTFAKQAVVVQADDVIAVTDITAGQLTYEPADTSTASDIGFKVVDANSVESEVHTLSIDRTDFTSAVGIANSGLVQVDTGVYSGALYINDALTGFDTMSSLRVVISAQGGKVKIGDLSGATQITTGFDYATTGGDEICLEGTEAQINAALKTLTTQITAGNEKVDISIDVQPGGAVYNPETGHFYQYVDFTNGIRFDDAESAAESSTFYGLQGYLATVTSQEEATLILQKMAANAWIGLSDRRNEALGADAEESWHWVGGPEQDQLLGSYAPWAPNEPNGTQHREDFAQMFASKLVLQA
ncbi:MAG: hypothetical protein EBV86_05955 [Marivivens sp.]|nr:hypothetical protein [Marivivens sp.]